MDTNPATDRLAPHFIDIEGDTSERSQPWMPLLVPRVAIEDAVARLLDKPGAAGQRRGAEIVHPRALTFGRGIAPGLAISVNVLRPGETLTLGRDNCSRVEFGIGGAANIRMGERSFTAAKWSTWTAPSMTGRTYRNLAEAPFVWLSYSNQPLLDRLGTYYAEDSAEQPDHRASAPTPQQRSERYVRQSAPDYPILNDGARLRGYEFLTDIEVMENKALIWPWDQVLPFMSREEGDGKRTIMLMYNPATERRAGTTHNFFATITSFPPGELRPPPVPGHRHSSCAVNYHFEGAGSSIVDGKTYHWEAGDLMLSAPSWSEHSHGFAPSGATVLTVQDHPFQIGIESLIWQERMGGPILTLGSEPGQTGYTGPRLQGE